MKSLSALALAYPDFISMRRIDCHIETVADRTGECVGVIDAKNPVEPLASECRIDDDQPTIVVAIEFGKIWPQRQREDLFQNSALRLLPAATGAHLLELLASAGVAPRFETVTNDR